MAAITGIEAINKLDRRTGGNLTRQTQGINFWLSEEELQLILDDVSVAPTCDMTAVSVVLRNWSVGGEGADLGIRGDDPDGLR